MPVDAKRQFLGLVTNTGDGVAPDGALGVADNVVLRAGGVIENREGFTPTTTLSYANGRILALYGYHGKRAE